MICWLLICESQYFRALGALKEMHESAGWSHGVFSSFATEFYIAFLLRGEHEGADSLIQWANEIVGADLEACCVQYRILLALKTSEDSEYLSSLLDESTAMETQKSDRYEFPRRILEYWVAIRLGRSEFADRIRLEASQASPSASKLASSADFMAKL